MTVILNIVKVTLEQGLMYAILAMGVYITYSILDFPDLSVDGTMPLGAIVTAILILHGVNPWLCLLLSFMAGMLAGSITGLLHVKLRIIPLLCGILMNTALLSINLALLLHFNGGSSVASFFRSPTIFNTFIGAWIPADLGGFNLRIVIVALLVCILCKLILDAYLKTKSGLLLRATGNNGGFVIQMARDPGNSRILGLSLGNGFAALAGSVIAQNRGSADQPMGVGMVILGLASVMIGLSLFKKVRFMKATTKVALGAVLYQACLTVALAIGLPTTYLKLLMAALFILVLVVFSDELMHYYRRLVDVDD